MENNGAKIREFVNDEEKLRALVNDEEFIEKVSAGKSTPEDYKKAFKKLELEMGNEEINQMEYVVKKVLNSSAEKLDDEFLKNITGGTWGKSDTHETLYAASELTLLAGLGCGIASCVYWARANKLNASDKKGDREKYIKKARNCGIAGASLIGTTVLMGTISYEIGKDLAKKEQELNLPDPTEEGAEFASKSEF